MASVITREQLYNRYIQKQEEIIKQLHFDLDKIQIEVIKKNEIGKTKITIAYNSAETDDGYMDILVKKTQEIFIDSAVYCNKSNELTIDWTFPMPSSNV